MKYLLLVTTDYRLLAGFGGIAIGLVISGCIINCHQRYVYYRSMRRIKLLADGGRKRLPDTAYIGAASMPSILREEIT